MNDAAQTPWLTEASKNAGWLIVLGVVQVIAGFVAMGSPLIVGIAVTLLVGISLGISGVARLIEAFKAGSFGAGALGFLSGLFALIVGGYLAFRPGVALATLTLVLAIYFVVDGIERIVVGFKLRPVAGWGVTVFGGGAGVILGVLIWRQWPVSGTWAVGTLVGIHLLFTGWSTIAIGSAARRVTKAASDEAGEATAEGV